MKQPSRFWRIAAILFVLINIAGAIYAVAVGEQMHAEGHLALLGVGFVGYLFMRGSAIRRQRMEPPTDDETRIAYLQQSVDAMALELERLGEAQRFHEKLKAERKEPSDKP